MKTGASSTNHDHDRLRHFYDTSAVDYDRWMESYDRAMLGDARKRVCARAGGQTLELAVGTGLNLPFYPPDVRLTAVDASPAMLAIASRRAKETALKVDFRLGDARALELPENHFDTVVSTLFLCTVADERRVATEAWRVLRPGGVWLLIEQVRSPAALVRSAQRLLDPVLARFTGDHVSRDPLPHLIATGFAIERRDLSKWGTIAEIIALKTGPLA